MPNKLTGVSLTLDKTALSRPDIEARCDALAREAMTLSGVPETVPLQRYKEVVDTERERWDYFCTEPEEESPAESTEEAEDA